MDIFSLRAKRGIPSEELDAEERPQFRFTLKGRTDLIVLFDKSMGAVNTNIRYYIEIKTVTDYNDVSCLKEAVLQVIGGNVAALYHSPSVLLTNLAEKHFVLYITRVDTTDNSLQYAQKRWSLSKIEQKPKQVSHAILVVCQLLDHLLAVLKLRF